MKVKLISMFAKVIHGPNMNVICLIIMVLNIDNNQNFDLTMLEVRGQKCIYVYNLYVLIVLLHIFSIISFYTYPLLLKLD